MRNLLYLFLGIALIAGFNSCKKCNECTLMCQNCTQGGFVSTICRNDYYSDAEYQAAVSSAIAGGSTCAAANETDKVCNSGLFFRTLQSAEITQRENSGWKCD